MDYLGKQYIVELKIWRGEEYNTEGEKQVAEYLDYYHLDKGYLLSFNFNKNKQLGMKTIRVNGKTVVEAVVWNKLWCNKNSTRSREMTCSSFLQYLVLFGNDGYIGAFFSLYFIPYITMNIIWKSRVI